MALLSAPQRPRSSPRRISGLGLVVENQKPPTPKPTPSPARRRSVTAIQTDYNAGPPLVPLLAITRADGVLETEELAEASPKYEEIDSRPWGQSTAVAETLDPYSTPKARPSSTFAVSPASARPSAWLFGDDEIHSPLVLSEKLPALAFQPSRRAANLNPPSTADFAPFTGSEEDLRLVGSGAIDSTGLPSYAAAMTPPVLVQPRWLDTPTRLERQRKREEQRSRHGRTLSEESLPEWEANNSAKGWKALLRRRQWSVVALVSAWAASLLMAAIIMRSTTLPGSRHGMQHAPQFQVEDLLAASHPTATLAENLRPGVRYLIGGYAHRPSPDLTEYFVSTYKLLYLGKLLHRVTIVPAPEEASRSTLASLSDIFDVHDFHSRTSSAVPLLELSAVKLPSSSNVEPSSGEHGVSETIGCWSSHHILAPHSSTSRPTSFALSSHGLDLQPWPLPAKSLARASGGYDILFESIVAFDWERDRKTSWITRLLHDARTKSSSYHRDSSAETALLGGLRRDQKPTEQLFCIDDTVHLGHAMFGPPYPRPYDGLHSSIGPNSPVSGEDQAWVQVGQHLRFRRQLVAKADEALRRLLNSGGAAPVTAAHARFPRFVAVRMSSSVPLAKYVAAVERVRAQLGLRNVSRRSFSSLKTLVFVDGEASSALRSELRLTGWLIANDELERVAAKEAGGTMKEVTEQVMMTRGAAFVGTPGDATSGITALRCAFWHGAPTAVAL